MRCLGEFVGHVLHGVRSDPGAGRRVETHRETVEDEGVRPDGRRVIVRRTIVEEVEVRPPERGS